MARRARGTIGRRSGRTGWWVRWYDAEGRRHLAFGGAKRAQAQDRLDDELRAVDRARGCRDVTLAEFLADEHFATLGARLAPKTYATQSSALLAAAASLAQPMDSVHVAAAEGYLTELAATRSPATVLRHRSTLSAAWKAAAVRGYVDGNPWLAVRVRRPQEHAVPFLTQEQLDALYEAAPAKIQALIVLLGETGMRRGEVLALRWGAVASSLESLTVARSKSGRVRTVPLRTRARATLATLERGDDDERVLAWIGETWTPWCRRLWRQTAQACGHPTLRLHDLRHARASLLVRAGVPVPTVARWLGHATPALVLTRYGHRAPSNELWLALEVSEAQDRPQPRRARKPARAARAD